MKSAIYLDYAAATPIDKDVLSCMLPYFGEDFYNPSAQYLAARAVHHDVEGSRAVVAKLLGIRPREAIFTAGGTEANNIAIQGVMQAFPDKKIVIAATEHKSVIEPSKRYNHTIIAVRPDGVIDMQSLESSITDEVVLVSVMLVNNEIGVLQPVSDIAKIITKKRNERAQSGNDTPLYLHTDACQAANYVQILPHRLGVDLMTINGGKIYGPKQSGMLFVRTGVQIHPLLFGGGQEWGMRSGTENVPAVIGFAESLRKTFELQSAETKRVSGLRDRLISGLEKNIPTAFINGSKTHRVANNVHITVPGFDNERLMMELDERGIQCAVGSACMASSDEPSHVLMALGISENDAKSSLRITLGRMTTDRQIDDVIRAFSELCHR